jgi:hypothetical protein
MRDFHAFSRVKSFCLSLTRDFHASCVIFTHSVKTALSLFIGFSAFWRVGIRVASVLSFFELPVWAFGPDHASVRVCASVRLLVTISFMRDRVCFGFTRLWRVCLCVFSVTCVTGTQALCLLACVSKNEQRIQCLCLCRACKVFR